MTHDDEHHRFAFASMSLFQPDGAEADRQGAIGVDHVAYTYASLGDLLEEGGSPIRDPGRRRSSA